MTENLTREWASLACRKADGVKLDGATENMTVADSRALVDDGQPGCSCCYSCYCASPDGTGSCAIDGRGCCGDRQVEGTSCECDCHVTRDDEKFGWGPASWPGDGPLPGHLEGSSCCPCHVAYDLDMRGAS